MDELPQLFSIIKGNMSLVGPRPVNQEVFTKLMNAGIDSKAKVKAGLTGHFQSNKNHKQCRADDLDREYVTYLETQPYSKVFRFDIWILLRTVRLVARAEGI